ncbi:MAG: MarR family winged helix-turn-helix transcriptional regulator [Actinomycetota bacterium]
MHDPEVVARVGRAWRELRRGAAWQALRPLLYGEGPDALDLGQIDALDLLAEQDGRRMSELADALRVDASTATRAVDRLVADGFVTREMASDDRRAVVVRLTPEGRTRHRALAERRRGVIQRIVADFEESELVHLAELLERMVAAVDRVVSETP